MASPPVSSPASSGRTLSSRWLLFAGTETGLYVSLNDGRTWSRMGGGLPVVPVYDLAVKGDELIAATHGRSFWVLDDLTPLRDLCEGTQQSAVHLFPPRARIRARRREIDPGDAKPGVVNYANAGTSPVLWDTVKSPHGEPQVRLLTAGTNPPAGRWSSATRCPTRRPLTWPCPSMRLQVGRSGVSRMATTARGRPFPRGRESTGSSGTCELRARRALMASAWMPGSDQTDR